jgi:hypothetical protein
VLSRGEGNLTLGRITESPAIVAKQKTLNKLDLVMEICECPATVSLFSVT